MDSEHLEKAGEGSRGGKVIGHTKSGKPIYQDSHKRSHKDWSPKDHKDAADAHFDTKLEYADQHNQERKQIMSTHAEESKDPKSHYDKYGVTPSSMSQRMNGSAKLKGLDRAYEHHGAASEYHSKKAPEEKKEEVQSGSLKDLMTYKKSENSMGQELRKALNMYGANHPYTRELIAKGRGKDLQPRKRKGAGGEFGKDYREQWKAKHNAKATALKPGEKDPHHESKVSMHTSGLKAAQSVHRDWKKTKPDYKPGSYRHDSTERQIAQRKANLQALKEHGGIKTETKEDSKPKTQGATKEYEGADAMNRLYGHHGGVKKSLLGKLKDALEKSRYNVVNPS